MWREEKVWMVRKENSFILWSAKKHKQTHLPSVNKNTWQTINFAEHGISGSDCTYYYAPLGGCSIRGSDFTSNDSLTRNLPATSMQLLGLIQSRRFLKASRPFTSVRCCLFWRIGDLSLLILIFYTDYSHIAPTYLMLLTPLYSFGLN
jgi:hypothetical protein